MARFGIDHNGNYRDLYSGVLCYQNDRITVINGERKNTTFTLFGHADESHKIVTAIKHLNSAAADALSDRVDVWLVMQADGEQVRRSIIYAMVVEPIDDNNFSGLLTRNAGYFSVAIEHGLTWETVTPTIDTTSLSVRGGIDSMDLVDRGDLTNRISYMKLAPTGSHPLNKLWVGFKPYHAYIGSANKRFDPNMNCNNTHDMETGTTENPISDTSKKVQAFGEDGKIIEITFNNSSDKKFRFSNILEGFNGPGGKAAQYPESYVGKYRVVCRYRSTDDSSIYAISLKYGHHGALDETQTAWLEPGVKSRTRHAEIGIITIPKSPDPSHFLLETHVGRFAGSGSIYIDRYRLIPAESSIYLSSEESGDTPDLLQQLEDQNIYITTSPRGEIVAWSASTNHVFDFTPADITWGLPLESVIVVAADTVPTYDVDNNDILSITVHSHPSFSMFGIQVR